MFSIELEELHVFRNASNNETVKRSEQFGFAYLRFAKKLEPGMVLTVESGVYFMPELINLWKSQNKFTDFINYEKVEESCLE